MGFINILMSTFNGEKHLEEQLVSILSQDCQDFILHIRDDGSSDHTLEILRKYKSLHPDKIQVKTGSNIGFIESFFQLLLTSSDDSDYFAFSDQDDYWLPTKISRALTQLNQYSNEIPTLYCSRLRIVNEDLEPLRLTRIPRKTGFGNALIENISTGCTIVMNKKARDLILQSLPCHVPFHDWWCYLIISTFGQVLYDQEANILYRQHCSNTFGASRSLLECFQKVNNRFFYDRYLDHIIEFKNKYGSLLPQKELKIVNRLLRAKKSFLYRLIYSCHPDIWRQSHLENILMRVKILMNNY